MKKIFFLILFLFPLSLFAQAPSFEDLLRSPYIVSAQVEAVTAHEKNPQGNVVQLKTLQFFRGNIAGGKILLFEETLFPQSVSVFSPNTPILIFLKDLPKYSAYQTLIQKGVVYSPAFKQGSVLLQSADQQAYQEFLKSYLPYLDQDSSEAKNKKKEILLSTLLQTASARLQEDLARFFERSPGFDLNSEEMEKLSLLVLKQGFSEGAKLSLVKYFTAHPSATQFQILKKFVCVSPDAVCLQSAERLEAAQQGLSYTEYSKLLSQLSPNLQAALLSILARHRRLDTLPLFETRLNSWSDDKETASILEALGDLGGAKAEELCLKYSQDKRYYVRMYSFSCLGQLKSEKAIPLMERVLNQHDPAMVSVIAGALENIGTPLARDTLAKYYEKGHHGGWEPAEPKHFFPSGK
ncbi:MAG: HEAT repeat domain-containing protein [Deltaproteobacteria bacterium]|nr:HEAT repeat domain-containing protein [Deltaproteobacteria bacterium]